MLYHNRGRLAPVEEAVVTHGDRLEDRLSQCDILSRHMPGSAGVAPIISASTLALLPRGSVLVNAARGSLGDEHALIDALRSGHLAGAGLDVYSKEPNPNPELTALPNVFLTPHAGSATVETRTAMGMLALDNVAALAAGKPLPSAVTA